MAEQNLTSIVGVVESVEGDVVIQQSDGGQNTSVSEGMQLAANQIIQTGPQGAVLINLANGQTLSLGRNTTLKLDEDVTGIAAIEDAQATDEDVQQVIEKVLAGNFDDIEETAAGEEAGISSSNQEADIVQHELVTGDVTSGFDTQTTGQEAAGVSFREAATDNTYEVPVILDIDRITSDSVVNMTEASGIITVTGSVSASNIASGNITLTVNGNEYYGVIDGNGNYAIDIPGSEFTADSDHRIEASATITDNNGMQGTATSTEFYFVDTQAGSDNSAPVVTITEDTDNDGRITTAELSGDINVAIGLPNGAVAGDTITVSDGVSSADIVLTSSDIANGQVLTSFANPGEGENITVEAVLKDQFGNVSNTGQDSALINAVPVAVDDTVTLNEDASATIDVLANDSDLDGDTISVQSVTQPAHGAVVINPDGTVTYTPAANYTGADSFTYTITDGHGESSTATVSLTVDPQNDQPVAVDDTVTLNEDASATIDVLANDSDLDGDTISVQSVTQPAHGAVVINPDGTVTYTPAANYTGADSFTYTITDGHGESSTATVSLTVDPQNDQPVAVDDTVTLNEDASATIDVLANDSDLDGDTISVQSVTQPAHGAVVINPDGTVTYTPAANYTGADSFTYTITDGHGESSTATVSLTVDPQNDQPVAVDDTVTLNEDASATIDVLANDSDLDGDTISVQSVTQPAHGAVVINPDGTVTYTPAANYTGADSFTYTITDGHGESSTATVSLTVDPQNDQPVAVDDTVTLNEDASATIDVLANDSDLDGDTISVQSVTQPAHGAVVINPDGTVTYTPAANYTGADSFTYTITDGHGESSTATVSLTVDPQNDQPVAVDDTVTLNEDASATIDVLANDSDLDGDTISVQSVTQPAHGAVVINPDGTVTYTPAANYTGADSFTYTITDGHGESSTATVSLTVDPQNDQPVAVDDTVTLNEDASATIDVLANDSDLDGDTISVQSVTQPAHGAVVINPDGTVTYTPAANYTGADSFTYTITDGHGESSTATVSLTVDPQNDQPVAVDDTVTLNEDASATIDVLANDSDLDGDTISVQSVTQPAHGAVVINPDGTVTYTPAANYTGADSFTYTITDGHGESSTATVSLTVDPQNDQPVAVDDTVTLNEDASATIDVLANDSDLDGDTISVQSVTQPAHGAVVINPDGTVTYTPAANYTGADSFTYTITDGHGESSTATVSLTVDPQNDQPVAVDDTVTLNEDASATIDVLANDSDLDGDTISVQSVTQPAHGAVVINPDGTVTYTPAANYTGADSFTYTITDGHGESSTATVSLTVDPQNDQPVAVDDTVTLNEDASATIDVLANDSDLDGDTISVQSVTQPAHGAVVINPDGTVTYTPAANYTGADSFTYTITDGHGESSTATVSLTVDPQNDQPVAVDDTVTLNEDASATIDVLANDSDLDGDTISVQSVTQPAHGAVVINPDGTVTYTPAANYTGADSFTYTITDGHGESSTATVSLTVDPQNDQPVAVDDTVTLNEDASATIDVLANDSDLDGDTISVQSVTQPAHGAVVINPDGTVTYTPAANYTGADSFTYTITDGHGESSTATVSLTVDPQNDQPVAVDDTVTLNEDASATIDVLANDSDLDGDTISVQSVTQPAHGAVVINPDGTVTYTPAANYTGADSFTYTITDGHGESSTATVSLTVDPQNDQPVAVDDTVTLNEDASATIDVLANDSDLDGDTISVQSVTQPAHGAVVINPDGTVTYTPAANYTGADSFTYTITDGHGESSTATVSLTVDPQNDQPVAVDDTVTLNEDASATIDVLANDSDLDGDTISVQSVTQPAHGAVVINPDGTVTYTPAANYTGADSFTYTITDGHGESSTATVSLTVDPQNDQPVAVDDTVTLNEDASATIDVLANDSDLDGDTISVQSVTQPAHGAVVINPDGTVTYTPAANYTGADSFTYTITDGHGESSTATVSLTVDPQNDQPVAVDDTVTLNEDASATIDVLANDSDLDGDTISVQSVTQPAHGAVVINPDGTVTYTPAANYTGADSFTYTITDGHGESSTATVSLTVDPQNDQPVAVDDTVTLNEDASATIDVLANDSDLDGDTISVQSVTQPAHGAVVINPDGTVTYTPAANYTGADSFTYTITDGHGESSTATVSLTVDPQNDQPVAVDDTVTLNEDASATIDVLANDSDLDGDTISVQSVTQPAHGAVVINPDGTVTYTPAANYTGADSFTYTITDGHGESSTATVSLTVDPQNDQPVAVDDTVTLNEDASATIDVLANDSDLDGDTISVQSVTQPAHGAVVINPDGTVTYTPAANYTGADSFTYTITDGHGESSTATVSLTVDPQNDQPVAVDDTVTLNEDASATIDVLANDSDLDGDTISVQSVTQPAHGAVVINPDGTVTYTPAANYTGADSFTYTITDGHGESSTATVSLTVDPQNDQPVAVDDTVTLNEDASATIDVLANDSDLDGDTISVQSVTQPAHGAVVINPDGTVTYTPAANYTGADSFTYTITDGHGESSTATVSLTVDPQNDQPVAVDDTVTLNEDASATIDVLANDSDLDGDTISVQSVTQPAHGAVVINPDGTVTYTPAANYTGADSFTYTITDGHGESSTATVSLTVDPQNDQPVAVDDTVTLNEDASATIDVLANDSDLDGDTISVQSVTQPAHGAVVINPDGTVTYTPAANYTGADSFTYTITDGHGESSTATVSLTVDPQNDQPVAVDDTVTLNEDASATIDVLANDSDLDGDTISVQSVTQPAHGAVVINPDGTVTYTPAANYTGADSFTYTITDGHGESSTATVSLTVDPQNDQPVAVDDTVTLNEDASATIDVLANDSDLDGDTISVQSVTQPAHGAVVINPDGTVTYTPAANYTGADSFTYTITDGHGESSTATVSLTVDPQNDQPVAVDDTVTLNEDASATIDVLANDSDLDGDTISVQSVTQPAHGAVVINPDGTVTYTPAANYTGADSFTYTITDGHGESSTATVSLTVDPQNDQPVAVDDTVTLNEDASATIDVLANDSDLDGDTISVQSVTQPAHGAVVINPDGTVTYTPAANYTGADSFTYTITDGHGESSTATVSLTVDPQNDQPVAVDDTVTLNEDASATIDVLANDSDLDGDTISVQSVTQPAHGAVVINPDGTVTYTPAANYTGADSFTYTITDGHGESSTATVSLTVDPQNDQPVAVDDTVTLNEDASATIDVLANDSDLDGDTISVQSVTQPAHGAVVINPDGTVTYTPAANYTGADSFTYTITDGHGESSTATVSLTVDPQNDQPVAVDDTVTLNEDASATIDVLANDSDLDGDTISVQSVTQPAHGAVVINPDGTVTYTPAANYTGADSFTYTITDGHGESSTATVSLTVDPQNDQPVAVDDTVTLNEDASATIDVLANDSDLDGDTISVQSVTQPAHGAVVINPDGTVTYTPAANYTGADSFTYTITDGHGESSTATVSLTVDPQNDQPVAVDDTVTLNEDASATIDVLANDSDLDGDTISVQSVTQPAHGAVVINPDGTVTYTPAANYTGADSFTYTITDGHGESSTATVSLTVDPQNDQPVAVDDTVTLNEDASATIDVLANDSDLDGDTISVQSVTQPAHGAVVINPDGTVTYTPAANYTGADSFTYTITDGHGESSTATVSLTVDPQNDQPVAVDDTVTLNEDASATIDVLANDSDLDGDTISVQSVTQPAHGAVVINPDGTVTYTPAANYTGADSFTYTITDGHGESSTATVSLTVDPQNDQPVAVDDTVTLNEDASATIDVLANDSDLDGDTISVQSVTQPAHGAVVINPDGTVTYTPAANYTGADSFTYTITDGHGESSTATVSLTVDPQNDQPVAVDDTVTLNEDASATIDVLANDSDLDGDTISVQSVTQPAHGAVVINPDGTVTYTPAANYTGADSFTYTITDGHGESSTATVSLTVDPQNDQPVAVDDTVTLNEDASATIDVLANDSDLDGDTISVQSVTQPAHGAVVINPDGTVTYTPAANYTGADSFTYTITDGHGESSTATVSLTVDPQNDQPVAVDDTVTLNEDASATIDVLANDSDLDGDTISVQSVTQPAHGAVVINPDGTVTYTPAANYTGADSFTYTITDGHGESSTATVSLTVDPQNDQPVAVDDTVTLNEDASATIDVLANDSDLDGDTISVQSVTQPAHGAVVINPDGTVTYTPAANYTGADSFTYTITDGHGESSTATVSLTVDPQNDQPVAVDDTVTLNEDASATIDVLANDSDLDGDTISVQSVTQPAHGAVVINPDGTVTYTPAANYTGADSFTYTITDGHGESSTATVSLTVDPQNDQPVAVDDTVTLNEDASATIDVLANDSDLDGDTISVQSVTQPAHGAVVINPDGTVTYTPAANYTGADSFTYTITDGHGESSTATVSLTVDPQNDQPVAVDDTVTLNEDASATIDVLANDSDLDGDTISVQSVTQPAHGAVVINPDGTVTYTPAANYTGADSFTYTITDGHGESSTATVSLTVDPQNDQPVAVDDTVTLNEDASATIDVLANDSDLDGDTISVQSVTQPAHGAVVINPDGTVTYTPAANYTGADSFTYTITDGHGESSTATVSLTVDPQNDQPVAVDDTVTLNEDASATIDVLANDSDLDGDTISVQSVTQPAHGAVVINPDGTVTYTPAANYTGADSFTYTITDGHGESSTATVSLTVDPQNDQPVAVDDTVTLNEDASATIDVLANDSDLDGDTISVQSVTQPAHGAVVINPDGTVTYTPAANYTGADSFTYTITDGHGESSTATVSLTVDPQNDQPVAVDDTVTLNEDASATIDVLANDSDLDGDTISVQSVTQPAHGAVVINPDGTVTYTPAANYTGADSFTYTITDGHGESSTATVSLTVDPQNDQPVAVDDTVTLNEDASATIDVLANDSDLDGDTISVQSVTQPAHGAVVINPDGTVTYTPAANYTGADSFTYTITDGHGESSTATVSLTVDPQNDQPVAVDDTVTLNEDASATIDVLANDSDLDGDTISVQSVTQPAHGAVVINPDGTVTYTPAANYTGADSFTYTITDGHGESSTATVSLTVDPQNDQPVAVDDTVTLNEDASATIDVLANDSDLDGDTISVQSVTQPAHGAVVINPDGTVTYTPAANYTGADSFTYTITDGHGESSTATVSLTVDPQNDQPVAVDDTVTLNEDAVITGQMDATDVDLPLGENLTFSTTADVEGLTFNSDGSYTFDASSYDDLDQGETQQIIIPVTVTDDQGATADATLTINVEGLNNDLTYVSEAASYHNVVGYFEVDENGLPVGEGTVVIDNQNGMTGGTHLADLDPSKEYGFFIISNAASDVSGNSTITFDVSGDTPVLLIDGAEATQPVYYDTPSFNPDGKDHFILENDGQGGTTISIEDLNLGDADFNDIVMHTNFELQNKIDVTADLAASSDTGDSSTDDLTKDNTPLITGMTESGASVVITDSSDNVVGQGVADQYGNYSITTTALPDGEQTLTVTATDVNGNEAVTTQTVTIDTVAEAGVVTVNSITDDDVVNATESGQIITVSGTATGGDISSGDLVVMTINGTDYSTSVDGDGNWHVDVSGADLASDTAFDVNVVSNDAAGNSVTTTGNSTHTVDTQAWAHIDVLTISPDNVISSSELSQNIPVIGYVKWDAKPGDPIKLYLDGKMIAEGTVSSDTNDQGFYTFSIDIPGSVLAQTDQIIPELRAVVTATDSAGNSFTASTTEVYGVDTEATPGTVTIDSVTGDNAVDTDESTQMVPISGTANGGDIQAGDEVTVTVNDQEYSTTVGSDGRWSIDVSGSDLVADADLTITANVLSSDAYGNQVESEGSRTYDLIENTAPDAQDDGTISSSLFFGLQGEYFGTNTQLSNISQFRELVENNTPDATFKAQNIDYQYGSGDVGRGTNLQTFLGSDADSLSNDPGNTSDAGIHLYGSIYLEAGTYNFKVNADDGYQIMIDGNAVAEVDYNQSSTTQTHAAFTITESGYHSIDMIWWDQGGSYVFQPELSSDGGHTYSTLDPSSLLSSENASDGLIVAEDNTLEIAPEQLLANDTDADGDTLSITDVSNAQNGQVVLNGDGSVTFTPAPDFFGTASFDYTISDGNGGTDTATVTVNVLPVNDVPVAHDETVEMDFEAALSNPGSGDGSTTTSITTNVVIALDISGSMDSDNRLELAKDALENMINAYDGQGSVNVKLVTFNSSGEVQTNTQSEVWMTAEEAINVIESLDANGYTNYEDAVYETYHNYSEPQADQTVAYFISDGEPTTERSGDGDYDYLSSWAQDGWNAFVGQYVDSLNVVALGDGISDLSYLETLAGAGNDVSEVIEVRNASELDEALTPAGTTLSVTGDLTDNVTDQEGDVSFTSISVGGVAYTASDFANGQTIALDSDGQLSVDFANGTYTYSASASEFDSDVVKTFTVNAQDEDGATVSFNVNIDVNVDDQASAPNVSLNIGDVVEVQEPVSNQDVWQGFDSKSDVITNPTYSTTNHNHWKDFSDANDQIDIGNKSNQWIKTEGGDDAVYIGNDDKGGINTGDGDDRVLIGDDANATIELEGGNDQLDIRGDADYINAGSGNDQVHIGEDATGTVELGAGDDELNIGDDSDYINAGEGNDRVYIGDEVKGTIDMGSGNDYLFVGGRLNGYIYGQSGTDSLVLDHYSLADYQNNVDGLRWKVNGFENILFGDGEVIGDSSAFASGEATSYHYALDVSASLTDQDGSETLSDVTINGLPADNSVSLQGTGVFDNGDGTYRIELQEDGSIADDVTMVSSRELTESELSDVHAAVTATEAAGGDTATTEVNEDEVHFLYGDDNEAEHFVIHDEAQSVEIENFDIEHDTLDLSEVIDDTPVDADDLSNYLNMIDNGDGTTTVNIDSDGDGDSSTGEQTQVVLDTYVDTNTDLNIQIDDQNIDYQNE